MAIFLLIMVYFFHDSCFAFTNFDKWVSYGRLSDLSADYNLDDGSTGVAIRHKNGGYFTSNGADSTIKISCKWPGDSAAWTIEQQGSTGHYFFKNYADTCYLTATGTDGADLECQSGTFIGFGKRWDLSGSNSDSATSQKIYIVAVNQKNQERPNLSGSSCTNGANVAMGTNSDIGKLNIEVIDGTTTATIELTAPLVFTGSVIIAVLSVALALNIILMFYKQCCKSKRMRYTSVKNTDCESSF
jgi:hypothetical protein